MQNCMNVQFNTIHASLLHEVIDDAALLEKKNGYKKRQKRLSKHIRKATAGKFSNL